MVTAIVVYILCKHVKLKSQVVTSLALHQIKEVGAVAKQEYVTLVQDVECTCKSQWYTILMLSVSILGLVLFIILFIILFMSDTQYYVPIKMYRMAGSIQLFKITGKCKIKKKYIL